jgi:hypothetical protein
MKLCYYRLNISHGNCFCGTLYLDNELHYRILRIPRATDVTPPRMTGSHSPTSGLTTTWYGLLTRITMMNYHGVHFNP